MHLNVEMIVKKLKSICNPQSENINFEEYKNCLNGENHQKECDNYILRSVSYQMFLQEVTENSLSYFDAKRCYESNN